MPTKHVTIYPLTNLSLSKKIPYITFKPIFIITQHILFLHFRIHYNIELKAIEVGDDFIQLPTNIFNTPSKRGTIIDSGTTLAYFPHVIYTQLMQKVSQIVQLYSFHFYFFLFIKSIITYCFFFLI